MKEIIKHWLKELRGIIMKLGFKFELFFKKSAKDKSVEDEALQELQQNKSDETDNKDGQ